MKSDNTAKHPYRCISWYRKWFRLTFERRERTVKPRMSKVIDGFLFINRGNDNVVVWDIQPWGCSFICNGDIINIVVTIP